MKAKIKPSCKTRPTTLAPDKSGVVLRFWVGFTPLAFLAFWQFPANPAFAGKASRWVAGSSWKISFE
jgi:hypothetical protein